MVRINETPGLRHNGHFNLGLADNEDPNEIQIRELMEALAHIKKDFEDANLTHARKFKEANRKRLRELEEANLTHTRELAALRKESKKAKETHKHEINV